MRRSARERSARHAVAAVVLVAVACPAAALCKLNVNPTGPCVEWTPAALLTGPKVVFVPFRFLGGAVVHTRECDDCGTGAYLARGAGQTSIALVYGPLTGFLDVTAGLTAIVMAGFVDWTEPDPTRFTLQPIRFAPFGDFCCFWGRPEPPDRLTRSGG